MHPLVHFLNLVTNSINHRDHALAIFVTYAKRGGL
jgi:hypothetical protein